MPDKEYWAGALWVLQGTIANAGTAGSATVTISPGQGNELEVLYGKMQHDDASSRAVTVIARDDDDNEIARFFSNSFANSQQNLPQEGTTGVETAPTRRIVAGTMDIQMQVASLGANQTFTFSLCCRIRGGPPSVALTSAAGATETTNKNQVF